MSFVFQLLIFNLLPICIINTQSTFTIYGKIFNGSNVNGLRGVEVKIINSNLRVNTSQDGTFVLSNILERDFLVMLSMEGYVTKKIPIHIQDSIKIQNIGNIRLQPEVDKDNDMRVIELSDQEFEEESSGEYNNITGLLRSTKDVFMKTVAYDFSPTFFRPRYLGSEHTGLAINGTLLNKIENGRPQWSNIGGLNDVLRNQEFTPNLAPANISFGGIAGTLNFNTQASKYRKGIKISIATSNRSYTSRLMATYSSGLNRNGWAYAISASRRYAKEGYREGTFYKAYSFFGSIEKRINEKHRLNFTYIFAKNHRGKSSPITMEVHDYKGIKYNSYWGYSGDKKKNSRQVKIEEPIMQISHYWKNNKNFDLQTNITYQFGKMSNSRLDYGGKRIVNDEFGSKALFGGGGNPDPTYYQNLPSYYLRNKGSEDYSNAYLSRRDFLEDGQIDWRSMNVSNLTITEEGGNSIYVLYDDIKAEKQVNINSIAHLKWNKNLDFNASIGYKKVRSENYAMISDLMGGDGFLDVDAYTDNVDQAQNNLRIPNRIVLKNEKFKYNYISEASILESFVQGQYKRKSFDFFLSLFLSTTKYQRKGLYENGTYTGSTSYGKSPLKKFLNYGVKGGLTYKLSGRHIFFLNGASLTKPPNLKNSFYNIRENNFLVNNLKSEKIQGLDFGYFLRHPKVRIRFASYWIQMKDRTKSTFYFANGLSGLDRSERAAFVRETLTNIDNENIGVELALETSILPRFKLKAVAALGRSIYKNNPNLQITSESNKIPIDYGIAHIKNYYLPGGPQRAYSIGLEYSNPNYWWFGTSVNYFSNTYISLSSIKRTRYFYLDSDGLPINDVNNVVARDLLKQETLEPYFLVNLVGGKSWKIAKYYLGFFINVGNILNKTYKTGGYEQSRNVNYTNLLADKSRLYPLFDSKYWFGYGTSFYLSLNLRI